MQSVTQLLRGKRKPPAENKKVKSIKTTAGQSGHPLAVRVSLTVVVSHDNFRHGLRQISLVGRGSNSSSFSGDATRRFGSSTRLSTHDNCAITRCCQRRLCAMHASYSLSARRKRIRSADADDSLFKAVRKIAIMFFTHTFQVIGINTTISGIALIPKRSYLKKHMYRDYTPCPEKRVPLYFCL